MGCRVGFMEGLSREDEGYHDGTVCIRKELKMKLNNPKMQDLEAYYMYTPENLLPTLCTYRSTLYHASIGSAACVAALSWALALALAF